MKEVCIYHISELYLYEYYLQPGEYRILPPDRINEFLEKGAEEEKRGGYVAAVQDYEKALALNPVRTETYFHLIRDSYQLKRLDDVHEYVEQVFPYVCTKAELAQYYRWLGCWYLETYQPELSEVVYRYSALVEKSRQAEEEIRYLETALGKKMPDYSVKELQDRMMKENIPVHASNVTAALLVKAGEEAQERAAEAETADSGPRGSAGQAENGQSGSIQAENRHSEAAVWRQQALDCYRMAYDLTEDPELEGRIRILSA